MILYKLSHFNQNENPASVVFLPVAREHWMTLLQDSLCVNADLKIALNDQDDNYTWL